MKKRILSIFLAFVICMGLTGTVAVLVPNMYNGESTEVEHDPRWDMIWTLDNGTLTISGECPMDFYGYYEDLTPCPPWAEPNWEHANDVKTVIIKHGIVTIGSYAFYNHKELRSIDIPSSVRSIESYAFYGTALQSVKLPNDVVYLGDHAFFDCKELTSVTLSDNLRYLENLAFGNCDNLKDIYYTGTEEQWYALETNSAQWYIENGQTYDTGLESVTIHYNMPKVLEEPFSGKCGNSAYWEFHEDSKELLIKGSGDIFEYSFEEYCYEPWYHLREYIETVKIESGITRLNTCTFYKLINLKNITMPDTLERIGDFTFLGCETLEKISIPEGVLLLDENVFHGCQNLKMIYIPDSVKQIWPSFYNCDNLTDVYYGGNQEQWNSIDILYPWSDDNIVLTSANVHFNSSPEDIGTELDTPNPTEYYYINFDPYASVPIPTDVLDNVTDAESAVEAVQAMASEMTYTQKDSAIGVDLITLYSETAISKVASSQISGNTIQISAASVADLADRAIQANEVIQSALEKEYISVERTIFNTITFTTNESNLTIQIDPDILTTKADKIRIETPTYALTFKLSDLEPDLTEMLTFQTEDVGSGYGAGKGNRKTTVKVTLPKGKTTNAITVSMPSDSGDTQYQAIVNTEGQATASKYNPVTKTMDGKINTSGNYTVQVNEKDFTDISTKSSEMQQAIRYLASKGIITGTTETTFSPDNSISRVEIAALLLRALSKTDSSARPTFTDVTPKDWFYSVAGASQRCGLIRGYEDNTFHGRDDISKVQIVAVASRVLTSEMNYKTPSDPSTYLSKFSDTVDSWAQGEVALATRENLVVYRKDGTFSGTRNMTRGDAAIVIYRLFQKIW